MSGGSCCHLAGLFYGLPHWFGPSTAKTLDFTSQLGSAPMCSLHPAPVFVCRNTNMREETRPSEPIFTLTDQQRTTTHSLLMLTVLRKRGGDNKQLFQIMSLPSPDTASLPISARELQAQRGATHHAPVELVPGPHWYLQT